MKFSFHVRPAPKEREFRGAIPDFVGKLIRYVFTGGTAALVDIAGFGVLRYMNIPVIAAAAGSFLVATVVNYVLSARWVFGVAATRRRYAGFLAGTLVGLTVNVVLTTIGMSRLMLPWAVAKAFGVAAAFLLNFWINANIVFRGDANRRLA
jgi:putative flippase GtrA